MIERRSFLKAIIAIVAAPIVAPTLSAAGLESIILPPNIWFGHIREMRAFDMLWDRWEIRWDLLGLDRSGNLTQLFVNARCYEEEMLDATKFADRIKTPCMRSLNERMRHHGINPSKLRPLPMHDLMTLA